MQIVVDEGLKAYIDPLTPDEYEALERSLLQEGCRDALVLWGDLLVDGHNRYGICQKHGLPFSTVQSNQFTSIEDVHLWMIEQHLGRRSLSDFQRGVLALRKRDILEARLKQAVAQAQQAETPAADSATDNPETAPGETSVAAGAPVNTKILNSREALAKAARISSNQVRMIEAIQAQAAPEVVAAVKSGDLSINAAAVLAQLPEEEQKSAASQGPKELKLAVKRVREARKKNKSGDQASAEDAASAEASGEPIGTTTAREAELLARIQALETDNDNLRKQVAALQRLLQGETTEATPSASADSAPF